VPVEARGETGAALEFSREHLVVLFDDDVLLGSGTLVTLPDESRAILTARHVVFDLVVAGAFRCVVPHVGWTSLEPTSLRVDPAADLALVRLPPVVRSGGVPWDSWNPSAAPQAALVGSVVAAGTPGAWKGAVDLERRTLAGVKGLALSVDVELDPPIAGSKAMKVPLSVHDLPKSFGGMSGGPVVDPDGRLLGVVTHESLAGPRRLYGAQLSAARNLVTPFEAPDAPDDMVRQLAGMIVPVRYTDSRSSLGVFHVVGVFEHFWSRSKPDDPSGRISRLVELGCATAPGSRRFVMNAESVFHPRDESLAEHLQQCGMDLSILLTTPGLAVRHEGPPPPGAALELLRERMAFHAPRAPLTFVVPDGSEV
jgi:hypothetical protein